MLREVGSVSPTSRNCMHAVRSLAPRVLTRLRHKSRNPSTLVEATADKVPGRASDIERHEHLGLRQLMRSFVDCVRTFGSRAIGWSPIMNPEVRKASCVLQPPPDLPLTEPPAFPRVAMSCVCSMSWWAGRGLCLEVARRQHNPLCSLT